MLAALDLDSMTAANDNAQGERVRAPRVERMKGWLDAIDDRVESWLVRRAARPHPTAGETTELRFSRAIRRACVRAALLGAASGAVNTAAAVVAVETGGVGLAVVVPVAAAAAAAEVTARAAVHAQLAATLAAITGDAHDPKDPWGRALLHELLRADALDEAQRAHVTRDAAVAGGRQFGAGLRDAMRRHGSEAARGVVPVLGIFLASIDAWRCTRRAGLAMVRRLQRED